MADFEDSTAPTWDNLLTGQQSCGMAAQVPIKGDDDANAPQLQRARDDKLREVCAGHDGTWVAHPALVPLAREVFDAHMPGANQHDVLRKDVDVSRDDLLRSPRGSITRAGFDGNSKSACAISPRGSPAMAACRSTT